MLKIVSTFRFRQDRPHEECRDYWLDHHQHAVAEYLPECRRYVQNIAIPVRSRQWPFDGVAEIWFDDMASIRRSFADPKALLLREDELLFSPGGDQSAWAVVEERPIFDR